MERFADLLRNGDEAGLRYFISQFSASLRFFAYKIVRNKEVSEEIVSESFVKLWNNKEKAISAKSVKLYLYLITKHACLDYIKSQYFKNIPLELDKIAENSAENLNILSQITYIELLMIIQQELNRLPARQAEIFKMAYLEGLETSEICDKLAISAENVYFSKSKAISIMRKILKNKGFRD